MNLWYTAAAVAAALVLLWLCRYALRKLFYRLRYPGAVIPCAWCPQSIYPGMPVTLYSAPEKPADHQMRAFPFFTNEKHKALVGCPYCADTGADYLGTWELDPDNPGKGRVVRHPSVYEALIRGNAEGAITTGPGQHKLL